MATIDCYPSRYYLSYGDASPAAVLNTKDIVRTRLVDAHGFDERGEKVADRPNPLTGPFAVNGAETGDLIAVTLRKMAPNRNRGWASRSIHPNLFTYQEEKYQKDYIEWRLDLERQTATPTVEGSPENQIQLPFSPVLGCIGVAPGEIERARSQDCGAYGGNMDLCSITTGLTLYLPVFIPGGLLYVGDGHAAQGAGEITGNGIEVSFDLEFSVELLKKRKVVGLRAETQHRLFAIANAKPLEDAFRQATEGMFSWLVERYSISRQTAGLLMGQLVDYQIGNLVSNAFTVACTMEKSALDSL